MATAIRMPALGQTSDELCLLRWLKSEGEEVTEGEPLFEVESDKATLEVEATTSGSLLRVVCEPGETVTAGTVLAWVGVAGEQIPEAETAAKATEAPVERGAVGAEAVPTGPSEPGRRVLATPAARTLAREHDLDLGSLTGTGPDGRVERRDVLAAIGDAAAEPRRPPA